MVQATGIGSGLDIEGLVTQLVNAERAPVENRLLQRETRLTSELSAFGRLQSALASFQDRLARLDSAADFSGRNAGSSDEGVVTASATGEAASASYSVRVDQLASAQSLASTAFADSAAVVGEGTLTLRFGTTDYTPADPGPASYDGFAPDADRDPVTITIDESNNTLAGVRDAINAADAGVSASIVADGSGARLLLTANDTGAANSVEISVNDGDGNDLDTSGLSQLAFNGDAANLEQTAAGADAAFSINGLALTSASNTVADAVDGVTLTLRGVSEGQPATVSVEADRGAVRSAIEGFVEAYNGFVRTAGDLTRYDPETGNAGPLQGDSSARAIVDQVRRSVTDSVGGAGSLAELGITTGADGTLSIDDGRLTEALDADLPSVAALFATEGTGVATRTDALLDGYLRSGGLFDTRTGGLQGQVDGIADDREALNRRLDALESRYRAQFNALDGLLAELQSTGDFVAQQLANIPLPGDRGN